MGTRGPVPKTNEARQRRNKESKLQEVPAILPADNIQPEPDPEWTHTAVMIWQSMGRSAQTVFYQASDWAVAYFLCGAVSAFEKSGRRNGQMISAILSGCGSLMLTEADRRRVGIQLTEPKSDTQSDDMETSKKWLNRLSM